MVSSAVLFIYVVDARMWIDAGPGAGSKKLGLRTTAAIIFGRLVLVPPAGMCVVTLADRLGFIPRGDTMFKFVLLLQHSMPTSVLSGTTIHVPGRTRPN